MTDLHHNESRVDVHILEWTN